MRQIVCDYELVAPVPPGNYHFTGNSIGFKPIVRHLFADNGGPRKLLDVGFGVGDLGRLVKTDAETRHWQVDGIDGFGDTCCNQPLFDKRYYRHVWHGLAQELPLSRLQSYDAICLFDVIEHLDAVGAKALLRRLLESLGPDSRLVLSTPLWFWPQAHTHDGDLEEHLIGIPSSSLLRLQPHSFLILNRYLIGTFVLSRRSLALLDRFQPTEDPAFDHEAGLRDLAAMGRSADDILYVVQDH